jgi:inorganic pyrophosphatase
MPGVVVRVRPIGLLKMTDEAGEDTKLLAVPIDKLTPIYRAIETTRDLPVVTLAEFTHFFALYMDLERGKWVKVEGWGSPEEARRVIREGVKAYKKAPRARKTP